MKPSARLNSDRLYRLQRIGFAWYVKKSLSGLSSSESTPTNTISTTRKPSKITEQISSGTTSSSKTTTTTAESKNGATPLPSTKSNVKKRLNDAKWDKMYQRLITYKETHGNCLVPKGYPMDPKLANWVETQRVMYSRDYSNDGKHGGSEELNILSPKGSHIMSYEVLKDETKGATVTTPAAVILK